jgi:hypothetical protein
VVRSSATNQVRGELAEAADLIAVDNVVYQSLIVDEHSKAPENAADYDLPSSSGL